MREESATLINAKSRDLMDAGRGGLPELTTQDLLGALAYGNCCNKYYRALSVFTGNAEDIQRFADPYLISECTVIVIRDRWQIQKGMLKTLCILAATELHNKRAIEAVQTTAEFIKHRRYYDQVYATAADMAHEAMRRAINAYDELSRT